MLEKMRSIGIGSKTAVSRFVVFLCIGMSTALSACSSTPSAASRDSGSGGRGGRGRGADSGAAPVVTARVAEKDVPIEIEAIGNVEASTMISVRSQVTGQLENAAFREGD
jgi:multidrug efflux pump subunit AcrA (membrane-fusion protein)